ncbi:MAG TPA: hypothetical protein VFI42_05345 [Thermomicrobiaceae bacterium]|nr:hypothetical protein [Thermomicrobiaceae bacterium]
MVFDRVRSLIVVVLALGLILPPPAAAASATPAVAPPTPGLVVSMARTDGDFVVWAEEAGGMTVNADILGARLSDGQVFTIAGGAENQINPRIDGHTVIWTVARSDCPPCDEIRGRNLDGGPGFTVAGPAPGITFADISGHWVVWASGNRVMARDIAAMSAPIVLATAPEGWSLGQVTIAGGRVAWLERTANANRTYPWQIRALRLGGSSPQIVASGVNARSVEVGLALGGDLLVYSVGGVADAINGPLTAVSLLSFASITIAAIGAHPSTDGRYIFWDTPGDSNGRPSLRGYDLQTASLFSPVTTAVSNGLPDLRNGALVWETSTRPDFMVASTIDIQADWLWQALPSGPRPNPQATSLDWFYFPETQHYLSFGFKSFWVQSGGLPVFGYPLTEEFSERNSDLGRMLTVQYLERQRFEYHPEHAGTPYEVELGRLGAEDAIQRNLVVARPFQPLGPAAAGSGCAYFAATGHTLCGGFLGYWRSHGLEFGDAGISQRESLALFGYPLSEEFTDPATGLTVQYFERARFEYHPENPQPYQVLLGRLGADLIHDRGWGG